MYTYSTHIHTSYIQYMLTHAFILTLYTETYEYAISTHTHAHTYIHKFSVYMVIKVLSFLYSPQLYEQSAGGAKLIEVQREVGRVKGLTNATRT